MHHSIAGEHLATSAPAAPDFFRSLPPRQAAPPAADSDSDDDAEEYVETTEFTTPDIVAPVEVSLGGERVYSRLLWGESADMGDGRVKAC